MAKVKKTKKKITRFRGWEIKKPQIWLENKIVAARIMAKPVAARAVSRFGLPVGAAAFLLIVLFSLLLPKDQFQISKEKVFKNPNDIEAHLNLAEEFLKNNDLQKTETELVKTYNIQHTTNNKEGEKVLSATSRFEELWQKWQEENPTELKKLIEKREKFVSENPTYRDGYLKLTLYYFKLGNPDKAKENLQKAIALDPNYEVSRKIEKELGEN